MQIGLIFHRTTRNASGSPVLHVAAFRYRSKSMERRRREADVNRIECVLGLWQCEATVLRVRHLRPRKASVHGAAAVCVSRRGAGAHSRRGPFAKERAGKASAAPKESSVCAVPALWGQLDSQLHRSNCPQRHVSRLPEWEKLQRRDDVFDTGLVVSGGGFGVGKGKRK